MQAVVARSTFRSQNVQNTTCSGHLKRICKDAVSVAGAVQETSSSGRCILEPQIFRFAEMILRDRCSTSYDLASLFRGKHSSLDKGLEKSQNALVPGRQRCMQLSIFDFVFDVVKFGNSRSLAELLRF